MRRGFWTLATILGLLVAVQPAWAESFADLRKLFDAGQYQQLLKAAAAAEVTDEQRPRVTYLVGQGHQRLSQNDEARQAYQELASRDESDAWHYVGVSAIAMLSSNAGNALEAANEAVSRNESLPEAHYLRGLALSARQDVAGAAASFDQATDLDPSWAYAHYYAGLAYSRAKRADLMATHFQTFLKLAPQAPESREVKSIMQTLGR